MRAQAKWSIARYVSARLSQPPRPMLLAPLASHVCPDVVEYVSDLTLLMLDPTENKPLAIERAHYARERTKLIQFECFLWDLAERFGGPTDRIPYAHRLLLYLFAWHPDAHEPRRVDDVRSVWRASISEAALARYLPSPMHQLHERDAEAARVTRACRRSTRAGNLASAMPILRLRHGLLGRPGIGGSAPITQARSYRRAVAINERPRRGLSHLSNGLSKPWAVLGSNQAPPLGTPMDRSGQCRRIPLQYKRCGRSAHDSGGHAGHPIRPAVWTKRGRSSTLRYAPTEPRSC
jgi:hypothetical protein